MNFIQQAYKGKNEWYHYLFTILLMVVGWQIVGIIPLTVVAIFHSKDLTDFQRAGANNFMGLGIDANLYLFLMIFMFAVGLWFLFLGIRYLHKRHIQTVITSRKAIDWKRFFYAFSLWFVVVTILLVVDYWGHPQDFVWNFNPVPFLILVLISFLFMPFQTSFEEVLFRGYLMQGLGILARNRWVPLVFTSVVFGLLHSFNPEIKKLGYEIMAFYIGTGFLFGITTLMDEGLELTLGLHAANNIAAALLVTTNWTVFQTDALFIDTSEPNLSMYMYVPLFVVYPLLLWWLSRKYRWTGWKEKLWRKIEKPNTALYAESD